MQVVYELFDRIVNFYLPNGPHFFRMKTKERTIIYNEFDVKNQVSNLIDI